MYCFNSLIAKGRSASISLESISLLPGWLQKHDFLYTLEETLWSLLIKWTRFPLTLFSVAATNHMHLCKEKFKSIKINKFKFSSSVSWATLQMPNSHMYPVVVILDGKITECSHCRKPFWTAFCYKNSQNQMSIPLPPQYPSLHPSFSFTFHSQLLCVFKVSKGGKEPTNLQAMMFMNYSNDYEGQTSIRMT